MRILIINGSPRTTGNISKMLEQMEQEAENYNIQTTYIRASKLSVRPCIGCMRTTLQCCFPNDDAQKTLQLIQECDALIIGAPCYWGNMPGELKLLFDRMVYGLMGETPRGMPCPLHKGKKAIIISTCTTPYPFNRWFNQSHGVVRALKEILKYSGFKIVKTIERGGTKRHPALSEKELAQCRRAIRKLL